MAALVLVEMAAQYGWVSRPVVQPLNFALPFLLLGIGSRLLQVFGRALQAAEVNRTLLEKRVMEATAEIERNFAQLSALRVEQVTEKERKRIAADLHDDLGAKLLTIVHTSESERISDAGARSAGRKCGCRCAGSPASPCIWPMRWPTGGRKPSRAWGKPTSRPIGAARPTTSTSSSAPACSCRPPRILREAVSNIIKHSGASQCKVAHLGGS